MEANMRKKLLSALRQELGKMDMTGDIRVLRNKDGAVVCRVWAEGRQYILKYLENPAFRREIRNYQILAFAEIPTAEVLLYTDKSLLMEDLTVSPRYRLGREEDLSSPEIARLTARWYRVLHANGSEAADLPSLPREDGCLTPEGVGLLRERFGPFPGDAYLAEKLPLLRKALDSLPQTICYNDFYWDNLAVARDGSAALLFDYNLLGRGYRYADVRNVTSSLSKEAGAAFIEEYGPLPEEERLADEASASLTTLLLACRRRGPLPSWAEPSLAEVKSGETERRLRRLLE